MSQEPTGISRVRIIGKQATNAEVAKYIASELSNPNMTKRKLAAALGTSRPTIDAYCKMAASLKIEIEASKETKISKIEETQPEFLANPYVKTWNDYMDAKTNFESKNQFLQNMYQICKTLRCPPQYFILGDSIADVLAQGRKLMTAFMQEYSKGTALVIYRKDPAQSNKQQAAYRFSKVARDFMKSHGYQYPTGEKGVMSQSVAPFHGKYSDIRIVEETHQNIKRELAEEHGAQSDEWLAYMFGMESFGREGAIFSAPTHHTMIESKGRAIMVLKVYESKTKHYHNGLWTKHLFDAELQTEIKRRASHTARQAVLCQPQPYRRNSTDAQEKVRRAWTDRPRPARAWRCRHQLLPAQALPCAQTRGRPENPTRNPLECRIRRGPRLEENAGAD